MHNKVHDTNEIPGFCPELLKGFLCEHNCPSSSTYYYIPKTKKFGCVTFLFKSCEIDRSQERVL